MSYQKKTQGPKGQKEPRRSGNNARHATNTKRYISKDKEEGPFHIYGLHTIEAAFNNPQRKRHKLFASPNALQRLQERNIKIDVPVETLPPRQIDKLVPKDAVHQGAVLLVDPLPDLGAEELGSGRLVLALDQVTDPHNVGAILRSAVALSADAVVTTRRHAPEEGPVLAKTASGALDMINHVRVTNLARFVDEMQKEGYQAIALDSEGPASLEETEFSDKTLLILGSEGKGVRHGIRQKCDALARLDMPGPIKSLNVSNAAILSLYICRSKMGL
ncbi:TrmH family RNA methyltransferase [Flexibacterium corallicola]|uniref:TrmH family RNA methyltransferase n=1 Tax=Flexibacterium corallicola TaxID=3037259 RepID=UPI00286FA9F2|nr:RNA methyltransferase [Pseudovibrio sp. M1P-2-3]